VVGGAVAVDDDGGSGVNSLIETELESGSYSLVARSYGETTGQYTLTLRPGRRAEESVIQGHVSVGNTVRGTIPSGAARTSHRWTMSIPSRMQVAIRLDKAHHSELDPHLALLDDKGDEIAVNDDGGGDYNSLIREELAPGTYTLVASGYASTSGPYELTVEGVGGAGSMLSFENDDHGFGTEDDDDVERGVAIGKYSFRSMDGNNVAWSRTIGPQGDGTYRVTTTKMSGPDRKGYGLIIRYHGRGDVPNMYLFEVNANGQFRFRRRYNRDVTTLVDWTTADCIAKGDYAQNTLEILVEGTRFEFRINGTLVNVSHDAEAPESFRSGYVGFYVGEGLHVLFDNLEVPGGPGR